MGEAARYRRLGALVLLWGIVPLPFLYIIQPPFWVAAAAVAIWVLARPEPVPRLSPLGQNLLALLIVVVVLAAGGARVGPLRPLGHLLLLLAAVRVVGIRDRRSFLGVAPALFLVWVVALTSATDVTVLLYFAASAMLWWWLGMEVSLLGVLPPGTGAGTPLVRPRHALSAAAAALLLAVPFFLAMPRLRSPWVAAGGGAHRVTGFSSRVLLSGVGDIRRSQEVALVVHENSGRRLRQQWSRLRATALEQVTADSWEPRRADELAARDGELIWLHGRRSLGRAAELEITMMRPKRYLFMPTGALAVRVTAPVRQDPAGGLRLAGEASGPLTYRVWVSRDEPPPFSDPPHPPGKHVAPAPEVQSLARRIVAGRTSSGQRAAAVEAFLRAHYRYRLEGMRRIGPDPIAWFLLESRQGHCEYFAGGMVVLLGSVGVPARMIAGYNGGEVNATGDQLTVREADAHTWVEAWVGQPSRWRVFDPTPAAGLPSFGPAPPMARLRVLWESVQTTWDRHVLTYGLGEQLLLVEGIAGELGGLLRWFDPRLAVGVAGACLLLWWGVRVRPRTRRRGAARRRRQLPAAGIVDRLAKRLVRDGVEVPSWATVRWVGGAAARHWPALAVELADLVERAESELYAADGRRRSDPRRARRQWARMRRQMGSHGGAP